jgi:2-polyprenyl-3-methyl-5-hydroxy-6-metoxy-1,4-benzoquinol methylase
LVFVPQRYHLSRHDEKARYALHTNTFDDPGYVDYLRRFCRELDAIPLAAGPTVLDFGSGPGFALTRLLRDEKGIDAHPYDPLYGIGMDAPGRTYDLVVLCEVIEHLRDLDTELATIRRLRSPGGYVAVRTEPYDETTDFTSWWYAHDPTHINFFHRDTMTVVAHRLNGRVVHTNGRNIFVVGEEK